MDHRRHPFRIGLRQGGIGREDGGHRGEVPTPHAYVKQLKVRCDHCSSAWLSRCCMLQGIRRSSTGSKPTDKEHDEETERSEQLRFSYVRVRLHRILCPFCDWPGTYSSTHFRDGLMGCLSVGQSRTTVSFYSQSTCRYKTHYELHLTIKTHLLLTDHHHST